MKIQDLRPGQRVRIVQEVERREGNWRQETTGVVLSVGMEKTGSWYAHSKDDKLWLARIRLQKPNGEITTINVDPLLDVEVLDNQPVG